MNKIIHAVVLAFFAVACWFIWGILKLPTMVVIGGRQLPAFTRLCIGLGPTLVVGLVILATAYCVWVWIRKAESRGSWVSFLATTMAALVLVMLPTMIAIVLPLIDAVNHLARKGLEIRQLTKGSKSNTIGRHHFHMDISHAFGLGIWIFLEAGWWMLDVAC